MLYLLNRPVLSTFGTYSYQPLTRSVAVELLDANVQTIYATIADDSTRRYLDRLTAKNSIRWRNGDAGREGFDVESMKNGDEAIVFHFVSPADARRAQTFDELSALPQRFALLRKEQRKRGSCRVPSKDCEAVRAAFEKWLDSAPKNFASEGADALAEIVVDTIRNAIDDFDEYAVS